MAQNNRRKIINLAKEVGKRCCYCGCRMVLEQGDTPNQDRSATIEHVYSKMDIRRLLDESKMLACYKCNTGKAKDEYKNIFNNGVYVEAHYKPREFGGKYGNILLDLYNNSSLVLNSLY